MSSIKAGGFELIYEINNKTAIITGIEGMDSSLSVPDNITADGVIYPVTAIGKKAFLGVNGLRHIVIPDGVSEIGDWAFSHCRHLVSLVVLNSGAGFGRGILEGCDRLKTVCRGYDAKDDLAFLMATVVNRLPANYLLGSSEAGSEAWFRNYDSSLIQYLNESDYAGSDESALCGEEDISYDNIRSVDGELLGADASYILGVRKNKNYLCLLRLMYNRFLQPETRGLLTEYVCAHTAGKTNNTAWLTVRDDLYSDAAFFDLYLEITAPGSDEIEIMLESLGNEHPEMKARLLKYSSSGNLVDNFFDDLLL